MCRFSPYTDRILISLQDTTYSHVTQGITK